MNNTVIPEKTIDIDPEKLKKQKKLIEEQKKRLEAHRKALKDATKDSTEVSPPQNPLQEVKPPTEQIKQPKPETVNQEKIELPVDQQPQTAAPQQEPTKPEIRNIPTEQASEQQLENVAQNNLQNPVNSSSDAVNTEEVKDGNLIPAENTDNQTVTQLGQPEEAAQTVEQSDAQKVNKSIELETPNELNNETSEQNQTTIEANRREQVPEPISKNEFTEQQLVTNKQTFPHPSQPLTEPTDILNKQASSKEREDPQENLSDSEKILRQTDSTAEVTDINLTEPSLDSPQEVTANEPLQKENIDQLLDTIDTKSNDMQPQDSSTDSLTQATGTKEALTQSTGIEETLTPPSSLGEDTAPVSNSESVGNMINNLNQINAPDLKEEPTTETAERTMQKAEEMISGTLDGISSNSLVEKSSSERETISYEDRQVNPPSGGNQVQTAGEMKPESNRLVGARTQNTEQAEPDIQEINKHYHEYETNNTQETQNIQNTENIENIENQSVNNYDQSTQIDSTNIDQSTTVEEKTVINNIDNSQSIDVDNRSEEEKISSGANMSVGSRGEDSDMSVPPVAQPQQKTEQSDTKDDLNAKDKSNLLNWIFLFAGIAAIIVVIIIFREDLLEIFDEILEIIGDLFGS